MKDNLLGKILKNLRIEKGLSQRAFGEIMGVVNQTVSFWESGSREPDLDTLIKIAHFYNVTVGFLLGEEI